jgi:transcriptional regulator with XRE-family HTH domain
MVSRVIGMNVQSGLKRMDASVEEFAKALGYSVRDAYRIVEGKVILPPRELSRIAEFLGVEKRELMEGDEEFPYRVLDLIDDFVELKEACEN